MTQDILKEWERLAKFFKLEPEIEKEEIKTFWLSKLKQQREEIFRTIKKVEVQKKNTITDYHQKTVKFYGKIKPPFANEGLFFIHSISSVIQR